MIGRHLQFDLQQDGLIQLQHLLQMFEGISFAHFVMHDEIDEGSQQLIFA